MVNHEKCFRITDTFLDLIPVVNTVYNISLACIKLAHKVDRLKPWFDSVPLSLKIHAVNRSYFRCFVGAVPVVGTFVKLGELVRAAIYGFGDPLMNAFATNNKEIVQLSLENDDLADPKKALQSLLYAVDLGDDVFKQIFSHRKEGWSAETLINALSLLYPRWSASKTAGEKANVILTYWEAHEECKLPTAYVNSALSILGKLLANEEIALAERIIKILPPDCDFDRLTEIPLTYPFILKHEPRKALIDKVAAPTLVQLENCINSMSNKLSDRPAANRIAIYCDILNQLIGKSEALLSDVEIADLISSVVQRLDYNFSEPLITKHDAKLTTKSKARILFYSCPDYSYFSSYLKPYLFNSLSFKWKDQIQNEAASLYEASLTKDDRVADADRQFGYFLQGHFDCLSNALKTDNSRIVRVSLQHAGFQGFNYLRQQEDSTMIARCRKQIMQCTDKLDLLPEIVNFSLISDLLLFYSFSESNILILTKDNRDALIAKSIKPSQEALKNYFCSVAKTAAYFQRKERYLDIHFENLYEFLERPDFSPKEIAEFITSMLGQNESYITAKLLDKYENLKIPGWKATISKALSSRPYSEQLPETLRRFITV